MTISQYLLGLKTNDIIDDDIMETIFPAKVIFNFNGMNNWAYNNANNNKYSFTYVCWVDKHISFTFLRNGYDLVSTNFRGCRMAKYINHQNQLCGCHIHCIARGHTDDRRNLWNQYVTGNNINIQNSVLFQPDVTMLTMIENRFPRLYMDLWGIIAQDGSCYSVIIYTDADYIATRYRKDFKAPVHLHSIIKHPKEPTMIIN